MQYVGIETQQRTNNFRSVVLLILFPCLVILLTYLFSFLLTMLTVQRYPGDPLPMQSATAMFTSVAPTVLMGVVIWFLIAYFANTWIINNSTGAVPLNRKDNKRVYNLVENLCMSRGMRMPKINIIYDDSLNAYASGIKESNYTVTLSKGIIDKLDDSELEAVIAHELTHIRNRDVRVLIVSIVFVGLFSMLAQIAIRSLYYSSFTRSDRNNKGSALPIILIVMVVAAIGFFFASLMRFAISRNREFMADAGAAEMTKNPHALASALRKISNDPEIEAVTRNDVAQLFIEHPHVKNESYFSGLSGLFATHPPIKKRIEVLEQF